MSSPFHTEPVALWEYLSLRTHTDTRVLQIQLQSIHIPQIAPKLSQPQVGLSLPGNYKYCFSLSQQTNATLPHPSYTAKGVNYL